MRRNHGDAVAHHSTQNTQHHTRTYQNQQFAHQHQQHTPINKTCTSRSIEEGGDGDVRGARVQHARSTGCRSHRFRVGGTAQPETCLLERTEEREAEPAGGRAALNYTTVTLQYGYTKNSHSHMHIHKQALKCSNTQHTCTYRYISMSLKKHTLT